jgi:glucuronokinase
MADQAGAAAGQAFARAALAGNPSDGYRGAVVAIAFGQRRAAATATAGPPHSGASCEPAAELVSATIRRFVAELDPDAHDLAVRWSSDIPRSVGLGGSSAIVIAVLRALCRLREVTLAPAVLAELALSIERDDLDIAAGLQDRVAQTHGPLTFMDFAPTPPVYTPLEPAALPPLLIAWRPAGSGASGAVHAPLRDRFEAGEPAVHAAMQALAGHARAAARALRDGDRPALRAAVDGSFDVRRSILALDPLHVEMIQTARAAGAAANYSGSGGAIVAVCDDLAQRERAAAALAAIGCETLTPLPIRRS